MKPKKSTLWSRNFTIITLGTAVSAIGGTAMNLALSLVVFDQTDSTLLSGLFMAASMLPGVTLPLLLGPALDRCDRKAMIVGLDAFSGVLYLAFLLYIRAAGFQYGAYILFSFITGAIGAVYSLDYQCFYPDLIPEGMTDKGYAVSSMIYPLATTLVTPAAAAVYKSLGIEVLFLAEGVLLLTAAGCEAFIVWHRPAPAPKKEASLGARLKSYFHEMGEGVRYLKEEKGVRSIYEYMTVTNACGNGNGLITMAFFQSSSTLTTAMYSLLISAETIGRAVGGAVHYVLKIPAEKRYALTVRVYAFYEVCDGILLFVAWPVMLVLKFLCGFLGVNTAALREAAVQNYLPSEKRARVNGLFSVLVSFGLMAAQVAAGALGEIFPYRFVMLGFAAFSLVCMLLLIVRRKKNVEPVYGCQY